MNHFFKSNILNFVWINSCQSVHLPRIKTCIWLKQQMSIPKEIQTFPTSNMSAESGGFQSSHGCQLYKFAESMQISKEKGILFIILKKKSFLINNCSNLSTYRKFRDDELKCSLERTHAGSKVHMLETWKLTWAHQLALIFQ